MTNPDADPMEALFAEARVNPPDPPDELMARVLADARAQQSVIAAPQRSWRLLWRGIGGLPGLSGLAAATVVGFWIGVAPPEALPDLAGQMVSGDEAALLQSAPELTAFGWDIEEG